MVRRIIENWERHIPHDHVWVNAPKLRADCIAAVKNGIEFALPRWDTAGVHPKSNEAIPNYLFWINTVNFNFSHPVKTSRGKLVKYRLRDVFGKEQCGAYAMGAAFYREFGEEPILAKHIQPVVKSLSRTAKFFKGYNSPAMLGERRDILLWACKALDEKYGGNPRNIFEAADYKYLGTEKQPGLYNLLTDNSRAYSFVPSFGGDIHGLRVRGGKSCVFDFSKRLNLLVVMYHDRAIQSGGILVPIADIDKVGPIPDYELPRSYEADGIFRYSDELYGFIDNAKPLISGSPMEIEIRAATVWAQYSELVWLNDERAKSGLTPLHIGHVDFYRWHRGKKLDGRLPHICLTTDY